ncbi:hypothetical protein [Natronocalculus amylovorans]|uniref:Uncharacterized protein n=1 Tax=Natronocalculus amylovorans TaxID=2917812 RepID=A0AAE3FX82_9EURY|nr:hypothetical protein [Natronocalculus amylovorans]MCL9816678.1 hypothetical protein [Natronocalculus amylovorans]NUE01121.1 hypothetical protein [Halorubraceae archaeon YAN]
MDTLPQQTFIGAALMVIGTLLFLPALTAGSGTFEIVALVAAAIILTIGTLLVGTSEGGRPV